MPGEAARDGRGVLGRRIVHRAMLRWPLWLTTLITLPSGSRTKNQSDPPWFQRQRIDDLVPEALSLCVGGFDGIADVD